MPSESEPRDTGNAGGQVVGEPRLELVPADRETAVGLSPASAFIEELHAVLPLRETLRRTIRVVGRAQDRLLRELQERERQLRDELERARVAHARTDEQLRSMKTQRGAQLLLQALGGVALGWAGGKILDGQPSWGVGVLAIAGLLFLVIGSKSLLMPRRDPS